MALMLSPGQQATYAEVASITTPSPENRHIPQPHTRIIDNTKSQLESNGWEIVDEKYGLNLPDTNRKYAGPRAELRNERGMNCWFQFQLSRPETEGWSFAPIVAGRNSHIQDFAQHLIMGTNMFLCSNGQFSSEAQIRAKHTARGETNASDRIKEIVTKIMAWAEHTKQSYETYKGIQMSTDSCITNMWKLYENKALDLGMLPVVKNEFVNPSYDEFKGSTMFTFAQACTEAMKRSPRTLQNKSLILTDHLNKKAGVERFQGFAE